MKENVKNEVTVVDLENVEAIKDYLSDFYSTSDMYETSASSSIAILHAFRTGGLPEEDVKNLQDLLCQHKMMVDLLVKFEKGGAA